MKMSTTSACASMAIAIAALSGSAPAAASSYRDTSAGSACHPVNPGIAFTYSNNYLTNTTSTNQYVVCHFQMDDDGALAVTKPTNLDIAFTSGATGGTIVCGAQEGSFFNGVNNVTSSNGQNYIMGPSSNHFIIFNTAGLTRSVFYDVLTVTCRVPPGFKMGLIEWTEG
jgi:hypothetical protein